MSKNILQDVATIISETVSTIETQQDLEDIQLTYEEMLSHKSKELYEVLLVFNKDMNAVDSSLRSEIAKLNEATNVNKLYFDSFVKLTLQQIAALYKQDGTQRKEYRRNNKFTNDKIDQYQFNKTLSSIIGPAYTTFDTNSATGFLSEEIEKDNVLNNNYIYILDDKSANITSPVQTNKTYSALKSSNTKRTFKENFGLFYAYNNFISFDKTNKIIYIGESSDSNADTTIKTKALKDIILPDGKTTIKGDVEINKTLIVDGNTTIKGDVKIIDKSFELRTSTNLPIFTVSATGTTYIDDVCTIKGSSLTDNTSNALMITKGSVTLTAGDLTLTSGNTKLGGTLTVKTDTTITKGNLTLEEGNALLSNGNLTLAVGNFDMSLGSATLTKGNVTLKDGQLKVNGNTGLKSTSKFYIVSESDDPELDSDENMELTGSSLILGKASTTAATLKLGNGTNGEYNFNITTNKIETKLPFVSTSESESSLGGNLKVDGNLNITDSGVSTIILNASEGKITTKTAKVTENLTVDNLLSTKTLSTDTNLEVGTSLTVKTTATITGALSAAIGSNIGGCKFDSNAVMTGAATAAYYADLAEYYSTDIEYLEGTVLQINEDENVDVEGTLFDNDGLILGVVTTNPAYTMNLNLKESGVTACNIALKGRIPVTVDPDSTRINRRGDIVLASTRTPGTAVAISKQIYLRDITFYTNRYIGVLINPNIIDGKFEVKI